MSKGQVGIIGLGIMGGAIAKNLTAAGWHVVAFDIAKDRCDEARTASVEIPGVLTSRGRPIINEFTGQPFHIALARPSGSFEFTYAEIGLGTTAVTGDMEMAYGDSWAHYCVHHFNQDGLVRGR